jgi:PHD/YefM family antitoxin component YafN of YafNO toxin-antitoxin module
MDTGNILKSLVSITQFNKGQAAKIFDRLKTERRIIVLKNNAPSAILLSPDEYLRLLELEEDSSLLNLAEQRLADYKGDGVPYEEALVQLDLTPEDIKNATDAAIE